MSDTTKIARMRTQSVPALGGWRPHDPHQWARETTGLSLSTRGALMSLADALWLSKGVACAIPDDDREIAAACGARLEWHQDARLRDEIRLMLTPHPDSAGMLTWAWLLDQWRVQLAAHHTRRKAGARGGRRRADPSVEQQDLPLDDVVSETFETPEPEAMRVIAAAIVESEARESERAESKPGLAMLSNASSERAESKPGLAMLSNASQSKSKRELLFSATRREKQFSDASRETPPTAAAPPAVRASAARGAAARPEDPPDPQPPLQPPQQPPLPPPPPPHTALTRGARLDVAAELAARERDRIEAEEREYYARRRRVAGAPMTSVGSVDWRSQMTPKDEPKHAVGVG